LETKELQKIIEGALLASDRPLTVDDLLSLFGGEDSRPEREEVKTALEDIEMDCQGRGFELKQVASGFRFQVRQELSTWIGRLWEEKPQRYSRALLETLAIVAYRQPVTRGEIEEIRGVSVSSNIVKTLLEREWIRVVGHRDVPGRPAILATTKKFLDYFNLRRLDDLPPLSEIRDLVEMAPELDLESELEGRSENADDETADREKPYEDPLSESDQVDKILADAGDYSGENDFDVESEESDSAVTEDTEGKQGDSSP
jgi:segregation and condensation protein B